MTTAATYCGLLRPPHCGGRNARGRNMLQEKCRNARNENVDCVVTWIALRGLRRYVDCVTWIALETWRNASSGGERPKYSGFMRPRIIFTKIIILGLTKKVQKDEIKEGINAPPNYGK